MSEAELNWREGMRDRRSVARRQEVDCICGGGVADIGIGVTNPDCVYHGLGSRGAWDQWIKADALEIMACDAAEKSVIDG